MKKILSLNSNNVTHNIYWGKLNGPTYVYLEITRKCNCACEFCQVNEAYSKDIDMNLFAKIVNELKELNCFELRLGGGEPLMNNNLENMLHQLNGFSIWICTNGILLNEKCCKMLKDKGVMGVRVSLDSLNEELHNEIRKNKVAFKSAVNNMKIAKRCGLEVCLSMTVGKHNVNEIEAMKKFASVNGYQFLTHFIMPTGKGKTFLENNSIKNEKKIELLSDYSGEKNCVAGNQSFAINIDGEISACTFLRPVGSVKERTIQEVINDEAFAKYKRCVPNANCEGCVLCKTKVGDKCMANEVCKGGCWALYEENN